jgi:hypothetical protein
MKTVLGYNLMFRAVEDDGAGGTIERLFAGTTSNTFTITPDVKESITKANKGFKTRKVTGYQYEFSAEGLVMVAEDGDTGDEITKDDLIDFIINKTSLDFVYGGDQVGDVVRKGKVIITGYTENSDSENEATYSVNFAGTVDLTKETLA